MKDEIRWMATAIILGTCTTGTSPAAAQDRLPTDTSLTVGVGIAAAPDYDGSDAYRVIPGGVVRGTLDGHDFSLRGPQLTVEALSFALNAHVDLAVGPVLGLRFDRTGSVRNDQVARLGELDTAIELGGFAALGTRGGVFGIDDAVTARLAFLHDVAGAHKSYVLTPSIEYSRRLGARSFGSLAISADVVGIRYASYYYSISASKASVSGLSAFNAKDRFKSVGASAFLSTPLAPLGPRWSAFAVAAYSRLQNDVARSPLVADVGSADQLFGATGIAYTF